MKRKRGPGRRKPRKTSGAGTSVNAVNPEDGSDINEENDGFNTRKETETRGTSIHMSGHPVDFNKPETNNKTFGNAAAKLARAISCSHTEAATDRITPRRETIGMKEPSSRQNPVYNKEELNAALSVIKKIMEMDAAVPFNTPVDPIALGIPDYFDVIDTPMDFGTIFGKLESGFKYRSSEEVFNDVQLIWDNCCKYNKKGSYIVELVKRVKSNFMKQWTAAGLYNKGQTVTNGVSHSQYYAESTMRHEEAMPMHHEMSNNSRSAFMRSDWASWNQRPHRPSSPCCSHIHEPQQMSYQHDYLFHPGYSRPGHHQHGMDPRQNHYGHMHPVDPMYGRSNSQWANEVSPGHAHPVPSYSTMNHPNQKGQMHLSTSSHFPPRFQPAFDAQNAGDLRVPHRDPTYNSKHALYSGRDDGEYSRNHHQVNLVHTHAHHPSSSHRAVHQLNQNTSHKFHSPCADRGRKSDCAGDVHVPHPTESIANCTRRVIDQPSSPVNGSTSSHEPDQINSSPEHGAHQPLEDNFQNQDESSPFEHLHATEGDKKSSQRKTRGDGPMECQEKSTTNDQQRPTQENDCRNNNISSLSPPPPTSTDHNRKPINKKSRGRGATKDLVFREGEIIEVTMNELGQPIGPNAQKLTSYLGQLARNGQLFRLTYPDWKAVPSEVKEEMWERVVSRFAIDPTHKKKILLSICNYWRQWKCHLKISHYNPHKTDEERLADRDERVLPDQWEALIKVWNSEEFQKRSATNRKNCRQHRLIHATGRKSFAQLQEEIRAKRPDGKELTREELFILTRTRKNGKPTNETTAEVINQLRARVNNPDTPLDGNKQSDVLAELIGSKRGRPRSKVLMLGDHEATRKVVSEANTTELREMKDKMAALEQTCAQMASQMAAMMSMISAMHGSIPEKNVPNMVNIDPSASIQSEPDWDVQPE